jgi:hypothetical protein
MVAMPFPWLQVPTSTSLKQSQRAKAVDMFRTEVKKRAELLMHLGHSQKNVAARCRDYLSWEFELNGKPPIAGEVDALVGEVFRRR